MYITVEAPEGAFPEGARLSVEAVPVKDQSRVEDAVEAERDENRNVAVSYAFDIKVLDANGEELQPANGQKVNVSFRRAEVANENLETNVYHITEDEVTGELNAESLTVETENKTATVETDGFSYYQVEFTYDRMTYTLEGDQSVALYDILAFFSVSGDPTSVEVSNPELFSAEKVDGQWIISANKPFTSTELMVVTIDKVRYEIEVTDEGGEAVATVKVGDGEPVGYDSLYAAIIAAKNAGENDTAIVTLITDIVLTDVWESVDMSAYTDPNKIIIQGNNNNITGLQAPLFGTLWGPMTLEIHDLTVKDSNIIQTNKTYNAAFLGIADAATSFVLSNCHVQNCTFSGATYTGGLVGYGSSSGTPTTIDSCSVTNCNIAGTGSSGSLIGHATGNDSCSITIFNTTASGNTISGEKAAKEGLLGGTAGPGKIQISATESGNTLVHNSTNPCIFGRIGTPGGMVTFTEGGSYSVDPTTTSDVNNAGYIGPDEGCEIKQNASGTYSVEELPPVAQIGDDNTKRYATLNEAVEAASAGDTIKLLANVTQTEPLIMSKSYTLDFNEHTISYNTTAKTTISGASNITFKNGTLDISGATMSGTDPGYDIFSLNLNGNTWTFDKMTVNGEGLKGYYAFWFQGNDTTPINTLNFVNGTTVTLGAGNYAGVFGGPAA